MDREEEDLCGVRGFRVRLGRGFFGGIGVKVFLELGWFWDIGIVVIVYLLIFLLV